VRNEEGAWGDHPVRPISVNPGHYSRLMTIVVTGGAGFIGSNLCRTLLARGHAVTVVDDLSTGFVHNIEGLDLTFIEGSMLDPAITDAAFAGADSIVHLGARGSVPKSVADPLESHLRNATGTIEVLEAARRAGNVHTVVASSSSVYGANPELPKHEWMATQPISPYAASKLATEWYALAYRHSYQLPALAFRFFNVYGPRQPEAHAYAAVMPAFIAAALRGEALPVHGDGNQSRDFTYVDTVCETIAKSCENKLSHGVPVNLAFGTQISLLETIHHLEAIVNHPLERVHSGARVGDVRHTMASHDLLDSLIPGIEPIEFREGLTTTVNWWRDQGFAAVPTAANE